MYGSDFDDDCGTERMSIFSAQKIVRKFGMLFMDKIMQRKFAYYSVIGIITPNNTSQASLSEHRRDAQTGGFLFSGVGYEI